MAADTGSDIMDAALVPVLVGYLLEPGAALFIISRAGHDPDLTGNQLTVFVDKAHPVHDIPATDGFPIRIVLNRRVGVKDKGLTAPAALAAFKALHSGFKPESVTFTIAAFSRIDHCSEHTPTDIGQKIQIGQIFKSVA